ncbi:molecular chaperone [Vibrio natriegens]|uniref:TorD/DmsD family molecular chaperone n=1 Tax=Vibrio natriegens TaxID=691 RepID=UPI0021E9041D|nr:molecular chaperone [Vibrio natriegens]UYI46095.1 molecular chaperone [Vibrio natriegens]
MIIHTLKILGTLFYHKRSKTESIELVASLVNENVLQPETLNALCDLDEAQFEHDFSVLFEGMGSMPVPPWGSVYLDKEQVLFGESNTQYRLFLQQHGIELDSGQREPEDQFGLMLLACAHFLEQDQTQTAFELLGEHLMPWGASYLEQLRAKAPNQFYQQLASDVKKWLDALIQQQNIHARQKKIYLNE